MAREPNYLLTPALTPKLNVNPNANPYRTLTVTQTLSEA